MSLSYIERHNGMTQVSLPWKVGIRFYIWSKVVMRHLLHVFIWCHRHELGGISYQSGQ